MNLLETLQKLLKEVDCMTTLSSFSRQITEVLPGDLTGKRNVSARSYVINSMDNIFEMQYLLALINRKEGLYGRILTEVVSTDRTQ